MSHDHDCRNCHHGQEDSSRLIVNDRSPIIELRGISMEWQGKTTLRDINLTINRGDFMAITGPNGGGKTTLLRIILRLLKPTHGTVTYLKDGVIVKGMHIGYLPQKNLIDSRFPITVSEVIASGLSASKLSRQEKKERTDSALETVGLTDSRSKAIGSLSGGQLQRALLGRAIISRPELIVLDEPLSYVDKRFERHIYGIVSKIAENATILLVSHEMSTIASMANRHLIVDREIHECSAAHHLVHYDCDE